MFNIIIPEKNLQVTSFWVEFLKVDTKHDNFSEKQYPLYIFSYFIRFDMYINTETHQKKFENTVIKGDLKGVGLIEDHEQIQLA